MSGGGQDQDGAAEDGFHRLDQVGFSQESQKITHFDGMSTGGLYFFLD
jgi:hypothetical protein